MNPNVEGINEHLFGVRFSWVEAGWIKDSPLVPGSKFRNPHATLTDTGKIVLNKDEVDLYNLLKLTLNNRIMPETDERIALQIAELERRKSSPDWDKYCEVLLFLLNLEQTRRTLIPQKKRRSWFKRKGR